MLGTSRGGFDAEKIVEWLRAKRVNQLYVIGGDGTHRGAYKLAELCWEKGVDVSVAGVPKTIDNDIGADAACKAWFLFRFRAMSDRARRHHRPLLRLHDRGE